MTPEQKAAIAAAAEAEKNGTLAKPADAVEPAPEPIEGAEPEEATDLEPSQPDYEAIAKAERERADAAEKAAAEEAFKAREARRAAGQPAAEPAEDEADKPLTRAEFDARMRTERQQIEKAALEGEALRIARENTATEAEAQAAVQFYKSRIVPTGNLQDDVLFAIGGLNRNRTAARATEVARALRSKETALHSTAQVHREQAPAGEPKISASEAQALKQSGMSWDGVQRVYKKPLGNGSKHFYFDPRTKRRWTA